MDELQPVAVDGWTVVEALWPINDDFRPKHGAFRALTYSPAHEAKADEAIERYLSTNSWGPVSLETWRVLLERHSQAIMVAALNARAGNPPMFAPHSLPKPALKGAAVIWLLHSMKLPFPPEDHSHKELPPGGPPVT